MSVFTESQAASECVVKQKSAPRVAVKVMNLRSYQEMWVSLLKWVTITFDTGKGINIPFLMKLTWRAEIDATKNIRTLRPVFILSESFMKAHNVLLKNKPRPEERDEAHLGKAEEINFAKIAIKYSQHLSKDQVFSGTRKMFQRIGHAMTEGRVVKIDFGVGDLICKDRKVDFVFGPDFTKRTLVENPQDGRVSSLEGIIDGQRAEDLENDALTEHVNNTLSRGPSRMDGEESEAGSDMFGISPTDDLRRLKQELNTKRSQAAIDKAYDRYSNFISARDKQEERTRAIQEQRLKQAEEEENRRANQRRDALLLQAEYIKSEIARKEDERRRQRQSQRGEVAIQLDKAAAFPIEPDPVPLQRARRREQTLLKNALMDQVADKQRSRWMQRQRDAAEERAMLDQIEEDIQVNYMQEAAIQRMKQEELNLSRRKQMEMKELVKMHEKRSPSKMGMSARQTPSPAPSRPASVGMRSFEIMTPDMLAGGVGSTPVFTARRG